MNSAKIIKTRKLKYEKTVFAFFPAFLLLSMAFAGCSMWGGEQDAFQEAMAEAGKSVSDYLGNGERIVKK